MYCSDYHYYLRAKSSGVQSNAQMKFKFAKLHGTSVSRDIYKGTFCNIKRFQNESSNVNVVNTCHSARHFVIILNCSNFAVPTEGLTWRCLKLKVPGLGQGGKIFEATNCHDNWIPDALTTWQRLLTGLLRGFIEASSLKANKQKLVIEVGGPFWRWQLCLCMLMCYHKCTYVRGLWLSYSALASLSCNAVTAEDCASSNRFKQVCIWPCSLWVRCQNRAGLCFCNISLSNFWAHVYNQMCSSELVSAGADRNHAYKLCITSTERDQKFGQNQEKSLEHLEQAVCRHHTSGQSIISMDRARSPTCFNTHGAFQNVVYEKHCTAGSGS